MTGTRTFIVWYCIDMLSSLLYFAVVVYGWRCNRLELFAVE